MWSNMGVSILTHKNLDTGRPQKTCPFDIPIANRRHHYLRFMSPHGDTALSSMSSYGDTIFSSPCRPCRLTETPPLPLHFTSWRHHHSSPCRITSTLQLSLHVASRRHHHSLSMLPTCETTPLRPCHQHATLHRSAHVALGYIVIFHLSCPNSWFVILSFKSGSNCILFRLDWSFR